MYFYDHGADVPSTIWFTSLSQIIIKIYIPVSKFINLLIYMYFYDHGADVPSTIWFTSLSKIVINNNKNIYTSQ